LAERSHLSIGEVLSLLRKEFPDVTISKIRFLESQGLVDPERTPSGYRKFYEADVERLRWILRQQRENFLPLKVIKGRLSEAELSGELPASEGSPAGTTVSEPPQGVVEPEMARSASQLGHHGPATAGGPGDLVESQGKRGVAQAGVALAQGGSRRPGPDGSPSSEPAGRDRPGERSVPEGPSRRSARPTPSLFTNLARPPAGAPLEHHAGEEATFTLAELAQSAGCTERLAAELEQYGLISSNAIVGGTAYFDVRALKVALAAAGLARFGVEPRHLRIWRNAVDREADLFGQLALPLLRQRNPDARRQAKEMLHELARLGGELRQALVERAVEEIR